MFCPDTKWTNSLNYFISHTHELILPRKKQLIHKMNKNKIQKSEMSQSLQNLQKLVLEIYEKLNLIVQCMCNSKRKLSGKK